MELYDLHTMKREEGCGSPLSVALGGFDGVHKGHAELIRCAVEYARARGIKSAVWTFSDEILPSKPDAKIITSVRERLLLIRELGVDYAFLADFDAVRDYSPEHFVSRVLIEGCGAVCAVCGFNFRFGSRGAGNAEKLKELMAPRETIIVPAVYEGDIPVSSSAVRALVESGDMEGAAALLSRPFSIERPVVSGKRLGRTIGAPTINQNFERGFVIPAHGVYACLAQVDGVTYTAAANVGTRPSVECGEREVNCETHIIGYDGDLYSKNVRVAFYKRLREETRFSDVDALRAQIARDVNDTKEYFKGRQI